MPTFASKSNGLLIIVSPFGLGPVHAQETALLAGVVAAEETLVPYPLPM